MLIHPQFDPVAIAFGPVAVRWYGLMYLIAFAQFWWLSRHRIVTLWADRWTVEELDDLLFRGVLGVIIGGRLGQVLFYEPGYYFSHPLEIFAVWKGGMSFHGGFIGVVLMLGWHAHKTGKRWLDVTDFVGPQVPLGLCAGRIGNFINGELWGRPADPSLPWAMIFPWVDQVPRHPSQIYQAGLEGLALFFVMWIYSGQRRALGRVTGLGIAGYGVFRFIAEYFRSPDDGIFGQSFTISMGQWLSLPMVLIGLWLLFRPSPLLQEKK